MTRIADIYSMCGIAGIISGNQQQVTRARLVKMTDAIVHRGPDGQQHWINDAGTAGMGHRRLSIIDLSPSAAQPMHYLNRYTIVHNGEIYNYIELRAVLAGKGYTFTSSSDTEVLVAAYDCWKENCLQYFEGMFAFAIWDDKEQILFGARDRFGEKPFFYWFNGEQLLFASEMKALWAAGIQKNVNEQLLFNFITLGYTQNPRNPSETAYQEINKLPAACFFRHDVNSKNIVQPVVYWQINKDHTDDCIDEGTAVDTFTALFTQSIKNRLRSDVPLGTSLSGGLDSSSIAAMIGKIQSPGYRLQTFSAVFPGFAHDESSYIQLLSAGKNMDNFTTQPTADDFIMDFEQLCYHQEGLLGSASVYSQYQVFKLAKEHHIKVLLDGQGADETLAGYSKYYHWYWQELYKKDKSLLQHEIAAARQLGVPDEWTWKNKLAAIYPVPAGMYLKNARIRKQRLAGGLTDQFTTTYGKSYYHLPLQNSMTNILYYNTCNNGLEELLQYADRNSMAHGRELRLPFLNHQLVEFIFSLPSQFKIKSGRTKWILRKAMNDLLPQAIAWRKDKIGFEPPQQAWMQDATVQAYIWQAKEILAGKRILKKEMLNKKIQPLASHAADNFDWRYLVAAKLF